MCSLAAFCRSGVLAAICSVFLFGSLAACGGPKPINTGSDPGPDRIISAAPGMEPMLQSFEEPPDEEPLAAALPAAQPPAVPLPRQIDWYQKAPGYPLVAADPEAAGQKVLLLTFDDGPSPATTPVVLDILKEKNVQALFFVSGKALGQPDLIKRIHAEGHQIGTHTMNHLNLRSLSAAEQRAEIMPLNEFIEATTGTRVEFFRPPFGAYNGDTEAILAEAGVELINWSHGSCDWCDLQGGAKDPAVVVADVLAARPRTSQHTSLHAGAIILMHDTLAHTAAALPDIIDGLKEMGYGFVQLSPGAAGS